MVVVTDIRKSYGDNVVLDGITLEFERGTVHALLGPNGAGKSTLLACLSGATMPNSGAITIGDRHFAGFTPSTALSAGTATIYQHFQLVADLSVADNIFLGAERRTRAGRIRRSEQRRVAAELVSQLGLDVDVRTLVRQLSVGQQQIVEIARALHRDPSLLILDEPTAALSGDEVDKLLGLVRRLAQERGIAVVYVTHLLPEVLEVADVVTVIRDGRVFWTRPAEGLRLSEIIDAIAPQTGLKTEGARRETGESLLHLDAYQCGFTGPVDLDVRAGEIVGVFGLLGSGRTDLLETLAGVRPRAGGTASLNGISIKHGGPGRMAKLGFALVPADRKEQALFAGMTSEENILMPTYELIGGRIRRPRKEREVFAATASHLHLVPADPSYHVDRLSGGNAQKVSFGRWLSGVRSPRVLLLDEPTQGVDVGARGELYRLLREFVSTGDRAVLFASSDSEETVVLADRIVVMRAGQPTASLRPPFDENELVALAHQSPATKGMSR